MLLGRTRGFDWDPFAEMQRFQEDMNRVFADFAGSPATRLYPPVNLWLGENSVAVTAELPRLSVACLPASIPKRQMRGSGTVS